ncbi:MAG: DNA-binding protein [Magnetococcales bacterium]|nr:DNA-binding protein [Magnetococcales bacterium]
MVAENSRKNSLLSIVPTGQLDQLPDGEDVLLRPDAAGRCIGLAPQTLARKRHEGTGPHFCKLGRLVFYRAGDLRNWINLSRRNHT